MQPLSKPFIGLENKDNNNLKKLIKYMKTRTPEPKFSTYYIDEFFPCCFETKRIRRQLKIIEYSLLFPVFEGQHQFQQRGKNPPEKKIKVKP